jgi:hypothetical protein
VIIPTRCPKCRKSSAVKVDSKGYEAWRGGELIGRALPNLSAEDREKLMTGYDTKCWDTLFDLD